MGRLAFAVMALAAPKHIPNPRPGRDGLDVERPSLRPGITSTLVIGRVVVAARI